MFPFTLNGAIRLQRRQDNADPVPRIVDALENMLVSANASDWTVDGREIRFTVDLWRRVFNWNVLVPFDRGRFVIEPRARATVVRYRLSTRRMAAMVTLMMVVVLLLLWRGTHDILAERLWVAPAIGWLWLFGGNYAIAMIRMPLWLKFRLRNSR